MPKDSLKDKLEGNELDLSMSELEVIPVKEIAAIPKATCIDLSCNQLVGIPETFCKLTYIIKLDLSKNLLTSLPEVFGNFNKLQHLDLLGNKLTHVPVGFSKLKSLKWLDLKDNPLDDQLKKVAGDCLNDTQCRACAKKMVSFMKEVESEQEKKRQKWLKEQRELETQKKVEEEREKQRKKAEKQAERERRRKEHEARKAAEALQQQEEKEKEMEEKKDEKLQNGLNLKPSKKEKGGLSCCGVLVTMLIGLTAILIGLYFYCDLHQTDHFCQLGKQNVEKAVKITQDYISQVTK